MPYRGVAGRADVDERSAGEVDGGGGREETVVGEGDDELVERFVDLTARLELVRHLPVHVAAQSAHLHNNASNRCPKVIRQKAASPTCHSSRLRMDFFDRRQESDPKRHLDRFTRF